MALVSSEQACVITGSKLAPQTHKVPVYCICYMAVVLQMTTHTTDTCTIARHDRQYVTHNER